MRYKFAEALDAQMKNNESIFFITSDLGYKIFDSVLAKYPDRAMTIGAAEQTMLGMAVGLAESGKIPVVYSITPFLLYRPFEIIRTYINHEKTNVKLIGCGRDHDYSHDGFTHFAGDDRSLLSPLTNISTFHPNSCEELESIFNMSLKRQAQFTSM